MWSTIEKVEFPKSLAEAYRISGRDNCEVIAGGSYLVSSKPSNINSLVDIKPLLSNEISIQGNALKIGAGATLQEIVENSLFNDFSEFVNICKSSNFSKNIRNQRTIGGEIAQGRVDSDLMVGLSALNPMVFVHSDKEKSFNLNEWDGNGIITALQIDIGVLKTLSLKRFAPLASAKPFLISAFVKNNNHVRVSFGGQMSQITMHEVQESELTGKIKPIGDEVVSFCNDDHYGSKPYKRQLIENCLKSIGGSE